MPEKNFSPQESLQLIQSMIAKTRRDMGDNSIQFLLWGWVTFACCSGQFILKKFFHFDQHYVVWMMVIPATLASIYIGKKQNSKRKITTYIGDSMKYLWMGMGICYFILSMILTRIGWDKNIFPFFIMLYGLGTFISGKFLQFKPLVAGGLMAWALAIAATFFEYDYQMLFGAAAILVSYIIPAYLLRNKNSTASDV